MELVPYSLYLAVSESAPTSPNGPSGKIDTKKYLSPYAFPYSSYKMAALSSSAPELEGMWTEVRRKQRAKALKNEAEAEVRLKRDIFRAVSDCTFVLSTQLYK